MAMMTTSTTSSSTQAVSFAPNSVDLHIGSASKRGAAVAVLCPSGRQNRGGFTLVEIILVLVILVTMGAVAWPVFSRSYESSKLKFAADKIMATLSKARVQAMTTGQTQAFRCKVNSREYAIEQVDDDSATLDANSTSDTSATLGQAASSAVGGVPGMSQLGEGYVFAACERVQDDRTAAAEAMITKKIKY